MTALPYLDLADPAFSTRSEDVLAARAQSWCARTPYGFAALRWREVGALLRDRRLRQGSWSWPERHGMSGPFTAFWSRSVIGCEGETHRRLRDLAVPVLSEDFVASLTPAFENIAADLCAPLRERETCEFQSAFAVPFAGRAVVELLGMDGADWENVSADASTLGLAMGVECKRHEAAVDAAYLRLERLARDLVARVRAGRDAASYIARMVARFDQAGDLSEEALLDMIVISIFGGVDTTRSQLGLGLALFIDHPAQWAALRADESLVPRAVEEMIAARPTTTWVTREAVETFAFEGVEIPRGATLHMLVHASARDPRGASGPPFDLFAKRKRHFGFGGGAHHCIGHLVARTDIAAALRSLRRLFEGVEYDGTPEWLPDSGNTSATRLPIRYVVAGSGY